MTVALPPINLIQETDFRNAWAKAIQFIMKNGVEITFGGPDKNDRTKIERKRAKDSHQIIVMTGFAIDQMNSCQLHPQFPTKQLEFLQLYCRQFTRQGVADWLALPDGDDHKATYIYAELVMNYPQIYGPNAIDQMKILKENLQEQIANQIVSNRTQAITWQPQKHAKHHEPPCLQRIQVRFLGFDENAGPLVENIYDWRSRDTFNAWMSNKVCINKMMNREVLRFNNARLVRDIDRNASLHVYYGNWDEADKVKLISLNPQMMGRA